VDLAASAIVRQSCRRQHCADRGYVLETGAIVLTGSGEALLRSDQVKAAYLGGGTKPAR
jgi:ABC-type branched-subunit amino acid transport system ATPase component